MNLRRLVLLAAAGAAALALAGCEPGGSPGSKQVFRGVDITGADYARTLSLPDQTGAVRSLSDFKGKVVVVFFGYT